MSWVRTRTFGSQSSAAAIALSKKSESARPVESTYKSFPKWFSRTMGSWRCAIWGVSRSESWAMASSPIAPRSPMNVMPWSRALLTNSRTSARSVRGSSSKICGSSHTVVRFHMWE